METNVGTKQENKMKNWFVINKTNKTLNLFDVLPKYVEEKETSENEKEDEEREKKRNKKIWDEAAKTREVFKNLPEYVEDEKEAEKKAERDAARKTRKAFSILPQGWGGKKSRNKRFRNKRKSKRRYR